MSPPYPPAFKRDVLRALRAVGRVQPVARAYGLAHQTVVNWATAARVKLPPATARIHEGNALAIAARWPGSAARREKARAMRAEGATLQAIADACGYRSIAAVHYALCPPKSPSTNSRSRGE